MPNRRRRRSGSGKSLQAKKRQQQQRLAIMVGGTIAVIVIGLFLFDRFRPLDVPLTDDYDTKYAEVVQGTSPEGYPQLGDPAAPIEIREFSSFTCPSCNRFHESIVDNLIDTHVRGGQVKIIFVPVDNIGGAGADVTAKAGYCALEQGMFWEMHDIMFHWQELVAPNKRRLNQAAEDIGMDGGKFSDCMNDGDTGKSIAAGMDEFHGLGLDSTPSVYLNGEFLDQDWGDLVTRIDGMVAN